MSILSELKQAVIDGEAEKTDELVQKALAEGLPPEQVLKEGLIAAMAEVGRLFEEGEFFVPEMLIAARAMKGGLVILRPQLAAANVQAVGKVVIGTVQGDLHDIGKNLVGMMCEGAGFEVVDLGFNVDPEKFIEAIKQHQPDIVGMSALLTTTMRAMALTIRAIEEAGLRNKVKIMVGGAPVDAAFAERISADGYGSNAPAGVDLAKQFAGVA